MRNKFPGTCYRCGKRVETGEGHFERAKGRRWLVQHADCAIKWRGTDRHYTDDSKESDRYRATRIIEVEGSK